MAQKKFAKSASWGKCQLGEGPVGGGASGGKCQLGEVPVGGQGPVGGKNLTLRRTIFSAFVSVKK